LRLGYAPSNAALVPPFAGSSNGMPDEAFDQEDLKMILISAQDCLRRDRKADLNLEFSIGSVADMANVTAIVLETRLRQMQSVAEAPLTAEQALKHLESGTEALSFASPEGNDQGPLSTVYRSCLIQLVSARRFTPGFSLRAPAQSRGISGRRHPCCRRGTENSAASSTERPCAIATLRSSISISVKADRS